MFENVDYASLVMDFVNVGSVDLIPASPMMSFSNEYALMSTEHHFVDEMNPIELVRVIVKSLTRLMWNLKLLEHILVKECLKNEINKLFE